MSRIGRMPITVPKDVKVDISGAHIKVTGPKGTLERDLHPDMILEMGDGILNVKRPTEEKQHKSLHGLTRTLVNNMVIGVTAGFTKELEVHGVGYRVQKQGKQLVMNLGYSHQVVMDEIPGISIDVPAPNKIVVSGIDNQKVGQFAAEVREKRPPEPYKGKGVRYAGEHVRRKEGKTGGKKK